MPYGPSRVSKFEAAWTGRSGWAQTLRTELDATAGIARASTALVYGLTLVTADERLLGATWLPTRSA